MRTRVLLVGLALLALSAVGLTGLGFLQVACSESGGAVLPLETVRRVAPPAPAAALTSSSALTPTSALTGTPTRPADLAPSPGASPAAPPRLPDRNLPNRVSTAIRRWPVWTTSAGTRAERLLITAENKVSIVFLIGVALRNGPTLGGCDPVVASAIWLRSVIRGEERAHGEYGRARPSPVLVAICEILTGGVLSPAQQEELRGSGLTCADPRSAAAPSEGAAGSSGQ